jgi:hypothetical protein
MNIGALPVPTSPVSQTGRSLVPASQLDISHHVSEESNPIQTPLDNAPNALAATPTRSGFLRRTSKILFGGTGPREQEESNVTERPAKKPRNLPRGRGRPPSTLPCADRRPMVARLQAMHTKRGNETERTMPNYYGTPEKPGSLRNSTEFAERKASWQCFGCTPEQRQAQGPILHWETVGVQTTRAGCIRS